MERIPEKTVHTWLAKLGIRVSPHLLKRQMKSHPDYPSLLSITDSLDQLGIENMAVAIEKEQLHEIPTPFLAHIKTSDDVFVLVENRDTLEEVYPGFFKQWSGVVIAAEKEPNWKHEENERLLRKEKISGLRTIAGASFIGIIAFGVSVVAGNWIIPALTPVALAGIFISWLIVSKELGISNTIADQVCGEEKDCDAIIQSKGSKLPFGIGWSDTGVIWFSSLLLILMLASFAQNLGGVVPVLSVLAVAAIPFTIYSLAYQWKIAKKWCRLCLITVGLLWTQVALLSPYLSGFSFNSIETGTAILIPVVLLIVSIAWFSVKALLKKANAPEDELFAGLRFKRSESVFLALLEKQKLVDTTPWKKDLQLGNAAAPLQIMVACSPYCAPCAKTDEKLQGLVARYGDKIGLTTRFTISANNKENDKTRAVQHIIRHIEQSTVSMNSTDRAIYTREILDHWFKLMDYEKFIARYPVAGQINVDSILQLHDDWTRKSEISFTPTIFINGFQLPFEYAIDDLPFLVNALHEIFKMQERVNETRVLV